MTMQLLIIEKQNRENPFVFLRRKKRKEKKRGAVVKGRTPTSRIRTSDLRMTTRYFGYKVTVYSPPLYQLSYGRFWRNGISKGNQFESRVHYIFRTDDVSMSFSLIKEKGFSNNNKKENGNQRN